MTTPDIPAWVPVTARRDADLTTDPAVLPDVKAAIADLQAARALPPGPERVLRMTKAMQRALQLAPFHPGVLHWAGVTLGDLGQYADAAETLALVARFGTDGMAPDAKASVFRHLGLAYKAAGRWREALDAFGDGMAHVPGHAGLIVGAHDVAWQMGKTLDARLLAKAARFATPSDPAEAFALAGLRCTSVTPPPFADLSARWGMRDYLLAKSGLPDRMDPSVLSLPRWTPDAGPQDGRVIVVGEQGAGDVIMAARYLPRIADAVGAPVLFAPGAPLAPLYARHPGVHATHDRPHANLGVAWVPLLDAVGWWGQDAPPIPLARRQPVRGRVGVCWQGNRAHSNDRDRSSPPGPVARVFGARGVTWVSLASGEPVPDGAPFDAWTARDWSDTLSRVASCEAVVTVDTAVAHLAGTLGVPTLLIPPAAPEWRWGDPRATTTAWYPSVTLHHRTTVDAWGAAWGVARKWAERVVRGAAA